MKQYITLFLLLFLLSIGYSQVSLTVNVMGLKNDKGQVVLLLFKEGQEFGIKKKLLNNLKNNRLETK